MTVRAVARVAATEFIKLQALRKARALIALCACSPFLFAVAMRVQSSAPSDTLFGRAVADSGFAIPLVVLGFGMLWPLPLLGSVVGGEMFSAEDRHGTWTTLLTRSRSRAEIFAGKVVVALAFSAVAVAILGASSIAAGLIVIGRQPLIGFSGLLLNPTDALTRVTSAWLSVIAPTLGFTALAVLISIASRSGAAGIGLPVVAALLMQLAAFVDGAEAARQLLIATAFGGWHGLFADPPYYAPLLRGTLVSAAYVVICLFTGYRLLVRCDVAQ